MRFLKTAEGFRRRRWATITLSLPLAMFLVASSCQLVGKYEPFERGDGAAPHPCDALPASKDDTKLGRLVLSKQSDGTCYWIDKTEVTVEQYSQFLAGHAQPIVWDAQRCAWKTVPADPVNDTSDPCTVSTNVESEPFRATKPIRCVDWCDAKAFCTWAGGDLCGGITNGSFVVPYDLPDQWGGACSAEGLPYVTGVMPVAGACNVGLEALGQCESRLGQMHCAPTDVGKFPGCTGPCGAMDMIGNVAEWVVSCAPSAGPDTLCQHRGGSFAGSLEAETCYAYASDARGARDRAIGLRCCAALTLDEQARVR
jgi:formylglycine-generating enzyme required for sulfatase activity